mmetsp:Transcript_21724/g.29909  ORF Transcript_21724/g.29909 Transcript_21724/m.29909 type:complete len:268 (+) Transcript_21724:117-920(+)
MILMKFFRDLSRFKSRKRLYGNQASLIPILMGKEEVIVMQNDEKLQEENDGFTMTLAELAEMDGKTETTPIYISVKGQIFDLSAARHFYGPGKAYHALVGKEAASAFAKGCFTSQCLSTPMSQLTEQQLLEVDRWIDLYRNHDKYKFVGMLATDPIDDIFADDEKNLSESQSNIEQQEQEQEQQQQSESDYSEEEQQSNTEQEQQLEEESPNFEQVQQEQSESDYAEEEQQTEQTNNVNLQDFEEVLAENVEEVNELPFENDVEEEA